MKAFPRPAGAAEFGMDLRDYFAAKALPVLYHAQIQYSEFRGYPANWKETLAKDAYAIADEMMKVRESR